MNAPRSADERVMALLEHSPTALGSGEVARVLQWSRQRARDVLLRLAADRRIERVGQERRLGTGRPCDVYTMPGRSVLPPPASQRLEPDTVVETPSGRQARVIRQQEEFVELEVFAASGEDRYVELHVSLVRPFKPGQPRPNPVRIDQDLR